MLDSVTVERRGFLRAADLVGLGAIAGKALPAWAQPVSSGIVRQRPTVSGNDIALPIGNVAVCVDGAVRK